MMILLVIAIRGFKVGVILLVLLLSLIMPLEIEDREGNEPFHSFPKKNSYRSEERRVGKECRP